MKTPKVASPKKTEPSKKKIILITVKAKSYFQKQKQRRKETKNYELFLFNIVCLIDKAQSSCKSIA